MSTDFSQTEYDAFAMDDVDPDAPGSGGGTRLPVGGYCVTITEVILQNKKGSTEVKCEVVNAVNVMLLGLTHTEYLRWPKAEYTDVGNRIAKEQLLAWCYAAETTSPEEIRARQQARQGFDAKWLDAMVGRQVLMVIKHETYKDENNNDRTSAKAEGRVWSLTNPKGKGIPGWRGEVTGDGQPTQATQQPTSGGDANAFAGLV